MRANRRDLNEKSIVEFWRARGSLWIPMGPDVGFDGLLVDLSGVYFVEIKNPAESWKLTERETKRAKMLESYGVQYHIIECLEGAAALVGLQIL